MNRVTFVRIPCDASQPLENLYLELPCGQFCGGDELSFSLNQCLYPHEKTNSAFQVVPLRRMTFYDAPMFREQVAAINLAGVYAYFHSSSLETGHEKLQPNERATCLAMACGLYSQRFYGDVLILRLGYAPDEEGSYKMSNLSISSLELQYACQTPDLRIDSIKETVEGAHSIQEKSLPLWLTDAAKSNFEDSAALSNLASVMLLQDNEVQEHRNCKYADESIDVSDNDSDSHSVASEPKNKYVTVGEVGNCPVPKRCVVTQVPLCLSCRRPSNELCSMCKGVYFCPKPRDCLDVGWSHRCLCKTWKMYTNRRVLLDSFPFDQWHLELLSRENQLSDAIYRDFLCNKLFVLGEGIPRNWWSTEVDGWSGGESFAAQKIDLESRFSYMDGFALEAHLLPIERPVTMDDVEKSQLKYDPDCSIIALNSWEEYYKFREIPLSSPVALLLTYPLTVYYALLKYGSVPITVAKMLHRQLRVHLVGIEKELNFIDIFKEVGFLLPIDLQVELVFIVRDDMFPASCKLNSRQEKQRMKIQLASNLTIYVECGTYNESIDPNFDCGTGPPDILIGLNAGLFAYKSWRSVIEYLNSNKGVTGVFTDYNEYSGVNCASLGGSAARGTFAINPFRQPHAMPVYSMNLPQFSNGFIYAFNHQILDV